MTSKVDAAVEQYVQERRLRSCRTRFLLLFFVDRNAQMRSSKKYHATSDDYVRPTENEQQPQSQPEPQYEVIQLDHTQHARDIAVVAAADDDQYDTLNSQTLGEQPQYDSISLTQSTDEDAAEYVDVD